MPIPFSAAHLMIYLQSKDARYHAKIVELRSAVEEWLGYIPATFPHYTKHSVGHSDEICSQLSQLLFVAGEPPTPSVALSAAEVYILLAAVYLHDIGMVVSDRAKQDILTSAEWKAWVSGDGGGARRWDEINTFRSGNEPTDKVLRDFLADRQIRFLIAEFARREHHIRSAELLAEHSNFLARFDFGDPILLRTIADVCIAHGLAHHELEDADRYPERRTIDGYLVNVRFLAHLLRIGDLLDMSHDRACPFLMNAASPLPADSLARWTKYQHIVHRLTAPDVIELNANCERQEEDRFLRDWCQWLEDEVKASTITMGRSARHKDWAAPNVSVNSQTGTIRIRPRACLQSVV